MAARKCSLAASAAPAPADDPLVASLIALMEGGTAPWRREWDNQLGGHHVNLFSGRGYRGANPILLTIGLHQRGASLPYWCGAGEARSHGLWPRRGSRAVMVVRPQLCRRGRREERVGEEREERSWVRYRPIPVFNAEDLEGETLAELLAARQRAEQVNSRSEPKRLEQAEAVLGAWPVTMEAGGSRAFYNPASDRIQLPDRRAFASAAAFCATWAHEAIHSTGHGSRLARDLAGTMGSVAYAREELVAELGAVLLGERLEIGSDVGNHAAYLAEWVKLLRETPRLLYKLLSEARQAANLICPPGETEI